MIKNFIGESLFELFIRSLKKFNTIVGLWPLDISCMFQECFDPIVDPAAGRDLIPAMVYG